MQSPAMRIFARKRDARGFADNKVAAREGGAIAGEARERLEQETGEGVVTAGNYLDGPEGRERLEEQRQERGEAAG
ncbi:MAG: hypothetical protein KKE83_03035 [Proteobacteria bacterium]|nr:hypothetical protein [Pseudomonadota bacterium]MBU1546210.1 hypothetical protein [Pseudomonadota bacterium]MBU2618640.1 hypothetical protein [Pseudomonadota bacterium]